MPDIAVPYVLNTPGGTITFNDGSIDQFYIQNIPGLGTAPRRTPIDDKPYTDGALGHNWWKTGRHVVVEGVFLVLSVPCGTAQVTIWNQMEADLFAALDSIAGLTTATGTLAWTPTGQSSATLTVRHDVPLEVTPDQNFLIRNFTFGLFAENPDWV